MAQPFADQIDAFVTAHHQRRFFLGSVQVQRGATVLFSKGYGMANLEHSIPNTPQTKFRIASITKQFGSVCILQLQERGLLSVEDKLSKFLPDFPNANRITLHQLMNHTAGVWNYTEAPHYARRIQSVPHTHEELLDYFRNVPLDFEPGTSFTYSNSGYILLSLVIEQVSGQSLADYLREHVLDPAGMRDSGLDHAQLILPGRATGYVYNLGQWKNATPEHTECFLMSGAMYSTVEDLCRWEEVLLRTSKLLSERSRDLMWNNPVDRKKNGIRYGYGIEVHQRQGKRMLGHSGEVSGFHTQLSVFPDETEIVSVAVLSNSLSSEAGKVADGIIAILGYGGDATIPRLRGPAITMDDYTPYVGKYRLNGYGGQTREIVLADPKLDGPEVGSGIVYVRGDGSRHPLVPESKNSFWSEDLGDDFVFVFDEKGNKVTGWSEPWVTSVKIE